MHCGGTSEQLPEVTCKPACSSSSTATAQVAQFGNHAQAKYPSGQKYRRSYQPTTCKSITFSAVQCSSVQPRTLGAAVFCGTASGSCYLLLETSCHNAKKGHLLVPPYCHTVAIAAAPQAQYAAATAAAAAAAQAPGSRLQPCGLVLCAAGRTEWYTVFRILLSQMPALFCEEINQANVVFKWIKYLTSLVLGFYLVSE